MVSDSPVTSSHLAAHIAQTARLAVPVMLSRVGLVLMLTVDTAIVGHLDGAGLQLAALGASVIPQTVLQTAAVGLLIGVIEIGRAHV